MILAMNGKGWKLKMFITLHGDYGRENVVNVNNITYFTSYDKDNTLTIVQFDTYNSILVTETVEEIKSIIKNCA